MPKLDMAQVQALCVPRIAQAISALGRRLVIGSEPA